MTRSSRDLQPFLRGLGRHFVSPTKRARGHIANQMPVQFLGRDLQLQALRRRLQGLIDSPGAGSSSPALDPFAEPSSDAFQDTSCPPSSDPPSGVDASDAPSTSAATTPKKKRYRQPAPLTAQRLYGRWTGLLPLLATPLLEYLQRSAGRPVASTFTPMHMCLTGMCMVVHQDMNLLFWDHYDTISVPFCECNPLPNVLVASGMFPTSPTLPRTAVSIDLLDLYLSLFERSGDAVTALARAIRQFYTKRGWRILDHKGEPLTDPFRKPLGHAVQWYDSLRVLVERDIDRAIDKARRIVTDHLKPPVHRASSSDPTSDDTSIISPVATCAPPVASSSEIPFTKKHRRRSRKVANAATLEVSLSELISPFVPEQPPEPRTTCDPVLQRRCPACFGGETFGQSFADGADIAVAVDGNFSHRHMRKAGDKPAFYDPEYFLPKVFVDAVGTWIGQQRQKPPKPDYVPKVPDAAVDSCQHGHEAANEEKAKTDPERFDDTGVMALVCSHDIPILMANIDTPGEQQKYAISLILWLFLLLPDNATVAGLYDIGCTTDRSINLYDLLPAHIVSRLVWAVSVMHAYGHEWVCQLVYNPRLAPGLGLRDGEGVERLWSCLRVLIPVTRTSARSRRIWILDRQVRAIGDEMRDHLGAWITRKLKDGVWAQYTEAKKIVVDSQISVAELRHQWAMQQEAQLSIRAHAPSRLKKGVEAVLALQAEIEHVDEAIADVMKKFKENLAMPDSVTILQALQFLSADLSQRAESLYGSLNVSDVFPELKDVHADFVRTLVLARDIKLNVRKRVTAQLLEFDRIDQAAGGKDNPLGTKLHQYTRRSIARRQPAIRSTIQKFNRYVQKLQDLAVTHSIADTIPIPRPLSTDVNELRNDPDFYEDVWVYPASGNDKPRWLHEQGTRLAIRALLKMERCVEEESRLHRELDHMCWWLGREIAITQLALQMVDNSLYRPIIQHRLDNLTLLQRMWANPLDKTSRLLSQVTWAQSIVEDILQTSDGLLYQPIQDAAPVVATFTQLGDDEDDDDNVQDDFANRGLDLLEVIDFLEVLEHEDESASEDSQSEGEEIGAFPLVLALRCIDCDDR
ncbi:hypothetical protein CERSUDRAFT_85646 [Gelatoporia subvermispora B]|uniref:CxC1-like cysteine cluster associated with KDZ transposases domain-containing protein n=1 Tax=Ceriporiopsis subvermispora (strain B) TaxID=914234 RepID=M2RB86_CERS8|nr:hypothetical protein CERSUDRAFT_85646 [Gelatoporia subvermispora B]